MVTLSCGTRTTSPRKTGREDMQRFALLTTAIGSVLMMVTTPSSLSSDLKKIRKLSGDMIHLHGLPGALEPSKGPIRSNDESSWILPAPNYTNWSENPYAADEGSELIDEHPIKVGTPSPTAPLLFIQSMASFSSLLQRGWPVTY